MGLFLTLCQRFRDFIRSLLDSGKDVTPESLRAEIGEYESSLSLGPKLSHKAPTLQIYEPTHDDFTTGPEPTRLPLVPACGLTTTAHDVPTRGDVLSLSDRIALDAADQICDMIRAKGQ